MINQLSKTILLLVGLSAAGTQAAAPNYADGDMAPQGAPDGAITAADYLLSGRVASASLGATEQELSHGDIYPEGAPDGVIDIHDVYVLQQWLLQGTRAYVETLDLFIEGPATVTGESGPDTGSTTVTVDGWTGSGTGAVINDPNFTDPADAANTLWHFSVSNGTANAFLGTEDLSGHSVLDSGFDLSGSGNGQLVFDIKVDSISAGATLLVKIDSGWPDIGQVVIDHSSLTIGSWQRIAIDFSDFLANPGPGGSGLNLSDVVNVFVIEVANGSADIYLDNIFVSHACADVNGCHATINTKPYVNYSLVWSDEFDGTSLNLDNWSYEIGYGGWGWGNGEWQNYTNSTANVSVSGGNLAISAQCPTAPVCGERDGTITSGRINTKNKFQFKFGKIEARMRPPVGEGSWPAFWMLGANFDQVGWPNTGEIDIMEMNQLYSNPSTTAFTMHWCNDAWSNPCVYDPGWTYTGHTLSLPVNLGDDFHVFEAEWNSDRIIGRIDGIEVGTIAIQPGTMDEFLEEFFAILNVAIGGTLGGAPDATTTWPQTMLVDYVRVYQADGGDGTFSIGGTPVGSEAALYSETHNELLYNGIINTQDWSGNPVVTDLQSSGVTPYDGSNVLEAFYANWNRGWGAFVFDLPSLDISSYQELKFAIDTSAMPSLSELEIKLESPGMATTLFLSDYVPTVSGNWAVYTVPLSDFASVDLTSVTYLGFFTPKNAGGSLIFGTLYFDDIYFSGGP